MKKRIKYLLLGILPFFGMLVAGCSSNNNTSSTSSTSIAPYVPPGGEPEDPDVADKYITAIHMVRTKDFFMARDENLDFNVTFDGGGDDSQKEISWQSSNPNVIKIGKHSEHPDLTRYCSLQAIREGTATIVARSLFNTSLTATVTITVIDNSDYTYMWQLQKNSSIEKAAFLDKDGYPCAEGTVPFGSMIWSYKFDQAPIPVQGGQSLKFGSKDAPFGALHFETENERQIRKISILCSSSAEHINDGSTYGKSGDVGTSNITVKVGDTTYIDNVSTPKNSNDSTIELDTVTGGVYDVNPMTGKISIDFSPTYYSSETKENSGAIYLKAIIIEYYRGELNRIEINEINEYNNLFFVGTKYDNRGIEVNAYFDASSTAKINVNNLATYSMNNIDENGLFINPNNAQTIDVSYTYTNSDGVDKTVSASYQVKVADAITRFVFNGSINKTEYLLREEMSYAGLSLDIYCGVEGNDKVAQSFDLSIINEDSFRAVFDVSNVHEYALKSLEGEFAISFRHYLSNNVAIYTFEQGSLIVKAVKTIEVIYDSEEKLALIEGEKMDYSNFKAKITYDNDSETTFAFNDLKDQTYFDTIKNQDLYRYNFVQYSPIVVDKSMETNGFRVEVRDALNNVTGMLDLTKENFSIKYITSISIKGSLTRLNYEESENMDYTGLMMDITYSDGSIETDVPFMDFAERTTLFGSTGTSSGNVVAKYEKVLLFQINAPEIASLEMMNGFDIGVASNRDETINAIYHVEASTLNITEVPTKKYQKITSVNDIVSGETYFFGSIEENHRTIKIWNGDLEEDQTGKTDSVTDGGNYISYTHNEVIDSTFDAKSGPISRSGFVVSSLGDNKFSVKHIRSNKYFGADNSLLKGTSSGKTQFETSFDEDGNAIMKATYTSSGAQVVRYIKFNTAANSNKFGGYLITNNKNTHIQLFKLVKE